MPTNLALGAATLGISVGYYAAASRIPDSQLADAIGPDGLPKIYAVLLAALSILLIARSLATVRRTPHTTDTPKVRLKPDTTNKARRPIAMLAIGAAYIVLVPWLGYLLTLAGLIFATTYCQGGADDRPLRVAFVALCGAIFCWALFVLVMRIPQPPGFVWQSLP
jgi:hypothetical protein